MSAGRGFTAAQIAAREASLPAINYPEELPVSARRDDIAAAIRDHQVVIVSGETGSGKTTQLPKICLELGRGITGMIGHTQPRRIAARAVADRIAYELGTKVSDLVGYQVRFTDEVSERTLIKLMTDGILLAEIQGDPLLQRYDTIIIDEAHERSLNIDFLLGYLARLLPMRPELKVIVTSATIDSARFAQHFARPDGTPAPIIEVSGRTYPVEIRYRPLVPELSDREDEGAEGASTPPAGKAKRSHGKVSVEAEADQVQGILDAVDELMEAGPGDILVFLPGERDIRDTNQALSDHLGRRYVNAHELPRKNRPADSVEVLPLFARLSSAEQQRVFQPHEMRRIVLATNVAETSLTVPGIRYVIDPGLARISRYSQKTKVQRLPIEAISQASANQRSGRSGRVADGIAIRLYSEADFESRPEFTEPEIVRTSLASVILQMAALGLGAVEDFPFVEAPDARAIRSGVQQLVEIGALKAGAKQSERGGTASHALTKIGRTLAALPIDPRLGRILLEGQRLGCVTEVGVIVAALSIQDIRERPLDHQQAADELHNRFTNPKSDFITYLNLWRYVRTLSRDLSGSAFRRTVRAEFLHYLRIREWQDVYAQLRQLAKPLGITLGTLELPSARQVAEEAAEGGIPNATARACVALTESATTVDADAIHQALLVGLLGNLGTWTEKSKDYEGARGVHFTIWPGSGLAKTRQDWVMAAELVETSRLFARTVAAVKVEWIEPAAKHLIRRVYSEPYWSRRHGAAMIKEKVLLYGMTLIADRSVPLGRLKDQVKLGDVTAAELAREMFIQNALVEGDWRTHHKFWRHNQDLLAEAAEIEARTRTPGLVADESVIAAFYESRVPAGITSAAHFDRWWKDARRETPTLLDFTRELLLPGGQDTAGFPDTWVQGDLRLPVVYQFRPGRPSDGLTVKVPVEVLARLRSEGFDWLVPGMLPDLVAETIRSLPKPIRRQMVPAPQWAKRFVPVLEGLREHGLEAEDEGVPPAESAVQAESAAEDSAESALAQSLDRLAQWATRAGVAAPGKPSAGGAGDTSPSSPTKQSRVKPPTQQAPAQQSTGTKPSVRPDENRPAGIPAVSFREAFTHVAAREAGVEITADDWKVSAQRLPEHVKVRYQVMASDGRVLGVGDDLALLQKKFAKAGQAAVKTAVKGAVAEALLAAKTEATKQERRSRKQSRLAKSAATAGAATNRGQSDWAGQQLENLTAWPQLATADDALPATVETSGPQGIRVTGYPGLATDPQTDYPLVQVQIASSATLRDQDHAAAVTALVLQAVRLAEGRISSRWNARQALALAVSQYGSTESLIADCQWEAARSLVAEVASVAAGRPGGAAAIRDRQAFDRAVEMVRERFEDRVYAVAAAAADALEQYSQVDRQLRQIRSINLAAVASEVKAHALGLVEGRFISRTGWSQLPHLARYLQADLLRLQSAPRDLHRDDRLAWQLQSMVDEVQVFASQVSEMAEGEAKTTAAAQAAHALWLLEEYRVSLFAQQLGTAERVSEKRIRALLRG
ncbi:ATP-dependent RNA helicase HrpA [Boudabousia marimammalium]|uniref:ATP-dependent RNA helicase HrpA n=1 Tax=Boudabousia marimammalium TaxID=156892 RepID=A0A1Q5PSX8_9ACTO|nr:ATP-dependent RNA helicase HrpA [Boudabousia marimammalium]OKL50619.1 ATP-dependent RNA helicase HrpA [Boudabousia marimammalium]